MSLCCFALIKYHRDSIPNSRAVDKFDSIMSGDVFGRIGQFMNSIVNNESMIFIQEILLQSMVSCLIHSGGQNENRNARLGDRVR